MKKSKAFSTILFFIVLTWVTLSAFGSDSDKSRNAVLDGEGKYEIRWEVNDEEKMVTFDLKVRTKGWVGFGISSSGKMNGSDIVIGGVDPNGKPYFQVSISSLRLFKTLVLKKKLIFIYIF